MSNVQDSWRSARFDGTYADAKHQSNQFGTYKTNVKRQWVAEKTELDTLLSNIQTKLKTYNLLPYQPPPHLTLQVKEFPVCGGSVRALQGERTNRWEFVLHCIPGT